METPCSATATPALYYKSNDELLNQLTSDTSIQEALLCSAEGQMEKLPARADLPKGFAFDRCAKVSCRASGWTFDAGDAWTAVVLLGEHPFAHEQAQSPDYPLHNIWNFYYAAANGKSQMTYQYHTSNPYATGVQMSLLDEVLCKTTRSF